MWTLLIVMTFAGTTGTVLYGSNSLAWYASHWKELTLATILFPFLLYVMLRISLIMKWCLYWLYCITAVFVVLDMFHQSTDLATVARILLYLFISLEACTVIVYLIFRYVYPIIVLSHTVLRPDLFWNIVPVAGKSNYYYFSNYFDPLYYFIGARRFSYIGAVNSKGQPHGFGRWTAEWGSGEILSGVWENGIAIGPFRSREYRTGYSFANVRIGYVETGIKRFRKTNTTAAKKLRYGVASTECSMSGKFFTDLPNVGIILDAFDNDSVKPPLSQAECLNNCCELITHYSDVSASGKLCKSSATLTINVSDCGLVIPGYTPLTEDDRHHATFRIQQRVVGTTSGIISNRRLEGKSGNVLDIAGWKVTDSQKIALIFIPGFNCSIEAGMKLLGQMMVLGALPHFITPFLFGWPGGNLFDFGGAIKITQNSQTRADFVGFVNDLIAAGFRHFHFLTHSMGARVVTSVAQDFHKMFCPIFNQTSTSQPERITLDTVTFLNPEASLNQFLSVHYNQIRQYCPIITLYGSTTDIALLSSSLIYIREPELGLNITHLKIRIPNQTSPDIERNSFSSDAEYLDMDVIDSTSLDANVQLAGHSFFSLNKLVVDDLITVISVCNRAAERESRLLHIDGNIYRFLAAPSYVVA